MTLKKIAVLLLVIAMAMVSPMVILSEGNNGSAGSMGSAETLPEEPFAGKLNTEDSYTLGYAVADNADGILMLSQEKLNEYFGAEVVVSAASGGKGYRELKGENGFISLSPQEGNEKIYLMIDTDDRSSRSLWSGIYSGKKSGISRNDKFSVEAILYPQQMVFAICEVSNADGMEDGIFFDISELESTFGTNIKVETANEKYQYGILESKDGKKVFTDAFKDDVKYARISIKNNHEDYYIWAGKFEKPEDGKSLNVKFHTFSNEYHLLFNDINNDRFEFIATGMGDIALYSTQLYSRIDYVNSEGKIIKSLTNAFASNKSSMLNGALIRFDAADIDLNSVDHIHLALMNEKCELYSCYVYLPENLKDMNKGDDSGETETLNIANAGDGVSTAEGDSEIEQRLEKEDAQIDEYLNELFSGNNSLNNTETIDTTVGSSSDEPVFIEGGVIGGKDGEDESTEGNDEGNNDENNNGGTGNGNGEVNGEENVEGNNDENNNGGTGNGNESNNNEQEKPNNSKPVVVRPNGNKNPAPDPVKLILVIDEDSIVDVESKKGGWGRKQKVDPNFRTIQFDGYVEVEGNFTPKKLFELLINGNKHEDVSKPEEKDGKWYFTAKNIEIPVNTEQITVQAVSKDNEDIKSEEKTLTLIPKIPVFGVEVRNYEGIYDAQMHAPFLYTEQEDVKYRYMLLEGPVEELYFEEYEEAPTEEFNQSSIIDIAYEYEFDENAALERIDELMRSVDVLESIPEFADAGDYYLLIHAEANGMRPEFYNEDGDLLPSADGWVQADVHISTASATVKLWAEAKDEKVYNGNEHAFDIILHAGIEKDESGILRAEKITGHENWIGEVKLERKFRNAGEQKITYLDVKKYIDFVKDIDPNYDISLKWDDASKVVIKPAEVSFSSESSLGLYGALKNGKLTGGANVIKGGSFGEDDWYNGNARAEGVISEAGVAYNEIILQGEFAKVQSNYDITYNNGVLVVFPQSISDQDAKWSDVQNNINPMDYKDKGRNDLPRYYNGMAVVLEKDHSVYNGAEHSITVVFKDANGNPLNLKEGVDYEVTFTRDGYPTDDMISAGEIIVNIKGIGNYGGEVEREYCIDKQEFEKKYISVSGWEYDGQPLNSPSHRIQSDETPDYYEYRAEGGDWKKLTKEDAPVNAGTYEIRAVWEADENNIGGMSDGFEFVIRPIELTVKVFKENGEIAIRDEQDHSLFDADTMILLDGAEYICMNPNFDVEFDVADDVRKELVESDAELTIESWTYDKKSAGSSDHEIRINGAEGQVDFVYYNRVSREEIDAPSDAGEYFVVAKWQDNGISVQKKAEFEILPRNITVTVQPAEKVFGENDPVFAAVCIELPDAVTEIQYEITRLEAGEDAGEYTVAVEGEKDQGNYRVSFINSILSINRKSIESVSVEMLEDTVIVSFADGQRLVENTDYTVSVQNDEDGKKKVSLTGIGNYTGEKICDVEQKSIAVELKILSLDGNQECTDRIKTDKDGKISFRFLVNMSNSMTDAGEVPDLIVNGASAPYNTIEINAGRTEWLCEKTGLDVSEEKPDELHIQININGTPRAEKTLSISYLGQKVIFIVGAVVLAACAAICWVSFFKLGRKIKRERFKLLDEITRQSNRTIRENE